jgi:hypothetical protein
MGDYLTEADYAELYQLAPNIRYAFEIADETFAGHHLVLPFDKY